MRWRRYKLQQGSLPRYFVNVRMNVYNDCL